MKPTSPLSRRLRAGFTIVEILVVVAIAGLIVGIVSVSMESLVPGERLNASIRELASELSRTRAEAISRNMEFRVEYDLENNRYRVATPFQVGGGTVRTFDDPEDGEQRYFGPWKELNPGVAFKRIVIGGVDHVGTSCYVRFDPLGAASDHSIILTQPAYDNAFTIEVLALTGLIRMHAGEYVRDLPDDGDFD